MRVSIFLKLIVAIFCSLSVQSYRNSVSRRSESAFAALTSENSVIAWGDSDAGGSISMVAADLVSGVQDIRSTSRAFACIKEDGSAVSWGDPEYGGDTSSVAHLLRSEVVNIFSTSAAFAALKSDGSVVCWGDVIKGGDTTPVELQLSEAVITIYSNEEAFAALKADGSIVCWGHAGLGGYISEAKRKDLQEGVVHITSSYHAFAAITVSGLVVAWGQESFGGDSSEVDSQLRSSTATAVYANAYAFAAVMTTGRVVTWGRADEGGDSVLVQHLLVDVQRIYSTVDAFAAVTGGGAVVTWGVHGGVGAYSPSPSAARLKSGVRSIAATLYAFAALKVGGEVVAWGLSDFGGDTSAVQSQLNEGIVDVFASITAFAALDVNGRVITWGDQRFGGNSNTVESQLSGGVATIASNYYAFAALKSDGSVVTWGLEGSGGIVPPGLSGEEVQVVDIAGTLQFDGTRLASATSAPSVTPSAASEWTSRPPSPAPTPPVSPAPSAPDDIWTHTCKTFTADGCPTNYAEAIYSRCHFSVSQSQYVEFRSSASGSEKRGNIIVFTAAGDLVYKGIHMDPGESVWVLLRGGDSDEEAEEAVEYYVQIGCCCDVNDCTVELSIEGTVGGDLKGALAHQESPMEANVQDGSVDVSCGAYIGWGDDVEYCYVTVCPGVRYTIYIDGGCENEIPLVDTLMGRISACDQELSFFGPDSCQLMEVKQGCGPGAAVCTYTTQIDAVPFADSFAISWGQGSGDGDTLSATVTTSVELETDLRLYLFQADSLEKIEPCRYMDFYQHEVGFRQFLEFTQISAAELTPSVPYSFTSRYTVTPRGGSYVLALVKTGEYIWEIEMIAQSPALDIERELTPIQFTIDSYEENMPLQGSWSSETASLKNDLIAIYRVNRPGVCNRNMMVWFQPIDEGVFSGEFDTDGLSEAELDENYYYSVNGEKGFFFTDECANDHFEIRYISAGGSREVLGSLRLDMEPTPPSTLDSSSDSSSVTTFYLMLTLFAVALFLICIVGFSVFVSKGKSGGSLYEGIQLAVLERYKYDPVTFAEEDLSSGGGDCYDGDLVVDIFADEPTQRASDRRRRVNTVVCHEEVEEMYL